MFEWLNGCSYRPRPEQDSAALFTKGLMELTQVGYIAQTDM
jgi:hypothetical protein